MSDKRLMLAHTYDGRDVGGWLVSEKLDGSRAFWDGGLKKWSGDAGSGREATGLWSRLGNPIYAPDWWLEQLPRGCVLDMELWCGRGRFQDTRSFVSKRVPIDSEWQQVIGHVICAPVSWKIGLPTTRKWETNTHLLPVNWSQLPLLNDEARAEVYTKLGAVVSQGAEGLMLMQNHDTYALGRTWGLLKVKPRLDSEATIVGTTLGEGKHTGRIGALVVDWKGVRFLIGTGMTDAFRGTDPASLIGRTVNFSYREVTRDGVPKEAAFERLLDPTI